MLDILMLRLLVHAPAVVHYSLGSMVVVAQLVACGVRATRETRRLAG